MITNYTMEACLMQDGAASGVFTGTAQHTRKANLIFSYSKVISNGHLPQIESHRYTIYPSGTQVKVLEVFSCIYSYQGQHSPKTSQ